MLEQQLISDTETIERELLFNIIFSDKAIFSDKCKLNRCNNKCYKNRRQSVLMKLICWKFHSFANEITLGPDYNESTGKTSNWWLVRVTVVVAEVWVVIIFIDGGNTQTLPAANFLNVLHSQAVRMLKHCSCTHCRLAPARTHEPPLVKLSKYLNETFRFTHCCICWF